MKVSKPRVMLALESSCDDTSAAVIIDGEVRSNVVATQKMHSETGGVVPEIASRAHLQHIIPVVDRALADAGVNKHDVAAVAATQTPGLIGSLIVGFNFGKTLAHAWGVPFYGVHHMKAHILAHWAEDPKPGFPFLCLTVSGGHTQLVYMDDIHTMEILGATIDDAAGEAYDKAAKMLGLPYPGGPLVDKYAQLGDPHRYAFGMPEISGYDYSFSGLKTSILYFLKKELERNPAFVEENLHDLCASIQQTIITILIRKLKKAIIATKVHHVGIAGGVSANSGLRKAIDELGNKLNVRTYIPAFQYCTDNAAMIGIAAYYQHLQGDALGMDAQATARGTW